MIYKKRRAEEQNLEFEQKTSIVLGGEMKVRGQEPLPVQTYVIQRIQRFVRCGGSSVLGGADAEPETCSLTTNHCSGTIKPLW